MPMMNDEADVSFIHHLGLSLSCFQVQRCIHMAKLMGLLIFWPCIHGLGQYAILVYKGLNGNGYLVCHFIIISTHQISTSLYYLRMHAHFISSYKIVIRYFDFHFYKKNEKWTSYCNSSHVCCTFYIRLQNCNWYFDFYLTKKKTRKLQHSRAYCRPMTRPAHGV